MSAILLSLQVGRPAPEGIEGTTDPLTKPHVTAIRKKPVAGSIEVLAETLAGDAVGNRKLHGGPDKAICAYPSEHYTFWQTALGHQKARDHGAFGENFTTQGLLETALCVGDVLQVGTAWVAVSQPRQPCFTLARHWRIADFARKVEKSGLTGWYFRVLKTGRVQAGDALDLVQRPFPQWTLARANDLMAGRETDLESLRELASCGALSADWRRQLMSKLRRAAGQRQGLLPL